MSLIFLSNKVVETSMFIGKITHIYGKENDSEVFLNDGKSFIIPNINPKKIHDAICGDLSNESKNIWDFISDNYLNLFL